ncbi:MAG: hypothetical protein JWO67_4780 [Streptosporangiaceae bacterium]|nr:hypothetical protein [Streptosporangiaceae bacterium]
MGGSVRNRAISDRVVGTPAGGDLFELFDRLTSRLPWRLNVRPFPLIVLEPEEDRVNTGELLGALEHAAHEAGIPAVSPYLGTDGARPPAISLLDTLADRRAWNAGPSQFGRFRFPRSELIKSFEAAARAHDDDVTPRPPHLRAAMAEDEWIVRAGPFPWRRNRAKVPVWWPTLGVFMAGILSVLAGGIAEQTSRLILVTAAAVLAAPLLLLTLLTTRRIWLPVAVRLGFGSRYRWLANSSFFAVLGGDGFDGRLQRVFERLVAPNSAEFLLQAKTFAFLEDLRDNHRKLTPSLRGLKRSAPPVVFLRGITAENGGVELLSAMSDIRSRRSELHPLLVVASADSRHREDLAELPDMPDPPGETGRERPLSLADRYESWEASLSTAQAPSQNVALPWLLRLPIREEPTGEEATRELAYRRRPRWTWLWSWRSLTATALLVTTVGAYAHAELRKTYCAVGYPLSWNADTRLLTDADHERECVGVATRGLRFESGRGSIAMDGELRAPDRRHRGGQITLADLQATIDEENVRVVRSGKPYVTIIHAAALTSAAGKEGLSVNGVKELAGAYLAQMRNNAAGQPGQVGNPLKIRLLAANLGQDMVFSDAVVDRILDIARGDPTVMGVVGMARNTKNSQKAVEHLSAAGLPVVSTVNSSDELPAVPHYYGLAATDHEEAAALGSAVRLEMGTRPIDRALIVSRRPGPSLDAYSSELAADAEKALRPRRTDRVLYVGTEDIAAKVKAACETAGSRAPTLAYFAGRAEDLPGLLNGLSGGGCAQRKMTLLAGDELATVRFGTNPHEVALPASMTVYYTVFAHLPNLIADNADQQNGFFLLARNLLGVGVPRVVPDEPLLVNAQMSMAYDATLALSEGAQSAFNTLGLSGSHSAQVPGSEAVTSGTVLLELRRLYVRQAATGDIDFRDDRHVPKGSGKRGLTLVRVALENGRPVTTTVCGRLGGGLGLRGLPACPG